ncbi:hypothetical protein GDO86_009791 [Hymenochirus boettgeri]|uniref:LIM zinc-binding domain-containing protein n=1 Tax=Hymenochirus boettgeri TaxID=247094 RepID=A0A8T2JN59_9PIPI|nr:hypothetical protein GDO86_009791 [Hymenochirus boettgeri]
MEKDLFHCFYCKEPLYGKKYTMKEESPYCVKCFDSLFANICEGCKKIIQCDSKDLAYKDSHWHETCFRCDRCSHSLVEKPFAAKDELLLCIECYSNEYSSKCVGCKSSIMPGSRKMEYKGNWHETCFACQSCLKPIGNKPFISKEFSIYCMPCYEKQYASQCKSCRKAIITGGISVEEQPWHSECFVCTSCKKKLAGEKFTSRDECPYCMDCFASLYAKKCVTCTKPITAQSGAKFISFDDRQWHSDCFTCVKCTKSLVGQKFLMQHNDILCPICGSGV